MMRYFALPRIDPDVGEGAERGNMSEATFLYVTAPDEDVAASLAETLVRERMAACANILPNMTSVYRWRGEIERAAECVLIVKTTASRAAAAAARIRALHPYDTPAIAALPVSPEGSDGDFLRWIASETSPES